MERYCMVGQQIVYVDPVGFPHDALITAWHGQSEGASVTEFKQKHGEAAYPCVNLIYVSKDPQKVDTHGRQIERLSSVCNKCVVMAHGNFWKWPDK